MKTSILKKSILDYAIKGELSARFRRENANLNALSEIESYNDDILIKRENLQKELKILESNLKKPIPSSQSKKISSPSLRASETSEAIHTSTKDIKAQIKELKQELEKCKIITPLNIESTKLDSAPLLSGDKNSTATSSPSLRGEAQAIHTPLPNDKAKTIDCHDFAYAKSRNDAFTPPFEIPNTWTWVRLGDICEDFFAGGDKPNIFSVNKTKECQIPIYTNAIKENGLYGFTNEATVTKNAITISARGTIGFVCPRYEPFFPIIRLIVLLPNTQANLRFLAYVLEVLTPKSAGTSIPQLTIPMLKDTPIPLPPLKEQQEIARILDLLISLANKFESIKEELKRIEKRIEKSLLKLALEGNLSKGYRRENPYINAYSEIESYNANILTKRENLQKELKILESNLKKPIPSSQSKKISSPSLRASETSEAIHTNAQKIKAQIKELKQELEKYKIITPLESSIENCSFQYKFTESKTPDSMDSSKLDSKNINSIKLDSINTDSNNIESKITESNFNPPFEIPSTWTWVRLGDIQIEINFENIKIPTKDYLKSGLYPIVSQDKEPISGFTNLETPILDLPIIVFGDHTCNIKYIDFPFFQGADGVKLIKPLKAINVKYLYFWLKSLNILKDKYTRHYKFIKNFAIPLPPLKEQQEIARILESLFTLTKGLRVE